MYLAAIATALDRISKVWARHALPGNPRTLIPGILSFTYAENRGMAFSLLSGRMILLCIITLLLIAGLVIWLLRTPEMPTAQRIGLWLVIGGGLGNLYDRIFNGFVVDFIRPDFINFAIFNLADVFICVGAGLALISAFISETRKGKPHG